MKIYLVDYLGIHCGMHYYLDSFSRVLLSIPNTQIEILSNYPIEKRIPFFKNQYKGSLVRKVLSLFVNIRRLYRHINTHRDCFYVYLTYGNTIDALFMSVISKTSKHIIDIHEAIAQDIDKSIILNHVFKDIYRYKVNAVISHSERTDIILYDYNFKNKKLFVPHFKYQFKKIYNDVNITNEIRNSIDNSRINLLFFGNLNENKGIDILIESINLLPEETCKRLNVIIAGKDFDGAIDRVSPKADRNVKIFRRHITDDELVFLYQNVDYISLPYRKTSQSGILEMAFYFKKPIIASNIPYFKKMLTDFPTFGVIAGINAKDYASILSEVIDNNHKQFYTQSDYDKYENRKEINDFILNFQAWINEYKS